eukprot:2088069-Prymnesium_polylepis.1
MSEVVLAELQRQADGAVNAAADLAEMVTQRMMTVTKEAVVGGSSGANGADNCMICLQRLGDNGDIVTLSCGRSHQCCEGCACMLLQYTHSCPQCRASVETYTLADGTQCDAPSVQHAEGMEPHGDAAVAQQLVEEDAYQRHLQRVRAIRREEAELARTAEEAGSNVVHGEVMRPPDASREERATERAVARDVRLAGEVSSSTPTPVPASDA